MAFKSEKDNALTKSLISFWIVSARAAAERQANATTHKIIAARMMHANVSFQLMLCSKTALKDAGRTLVELCKGLPSWRQKHLSPRSPSKVFSIITRNSYETSKIFIVVQVPK
jgi:hypothetical protein